MEPSPWLLGVMLVIGLMAIYWVLFGQRKAQQETESNDKDK